MSVGNTRGMSSEESRPAGMTSSAQPQPEPTTEVAGEESNQTFLYTSVVATYEMYCPPPAKEMVEKYVEPLSSKLSTYGSKYVSPNERELHLAHGAAILVWGGSHYWLALLMAFYNLFDVEGVMAFCKALLSKTSAQTSGVTPTNLRMVIFKLVNLLVCFRSVWYSDFFAAVAIACSLEGEVMANVCCTTVYKQLVTMLESTGRVPREMKSTVEQWLPFFTTCAIRFVLTLLCFAMPYTTACVFLAVYGGNKIYNSCSKTMQKALSKPVTSLKVEAKNLLIVGITVLSALWQFINAFDSNLMFNLFVPLGFMLPALAMKTSAGSMKQS